MSLTKIKSTHPESQGPFVLIESEDFDAAKGHELFEPEAQDAPPQPEGKGKKSAPASA